MTNWRDKLHRWIDGDELKEADKVLIEKSANYESEGFLRNLLRRIDKVLKLEVVRLLKDTDFNFRPLYRLEIFRDGNLLYTFPIIKPEITISRDEEDSPANIRLQSNNRKLSRLQAEIQIKDTGEIRVTALHKSPIFVSGKAIVEDEKVKLERNGEIQIYEYILRLKFSE